MNKPLKWIKNNLHPDGGIRSKPGGPPYSEITGYLIPSLIDWNEVDLAFEFADWLLTVQNDDGSFNGLDGIPRTFDTAACHEGLWTAGLEDGANKAKNWLHSMHDDGEFWTDIHRREKNIYTLRINGLLSIPVELPKKLWPNRTHYIAYALEGLYLLGEFEYVAENLEWLKWHLKNGFAPHEIYDEGISFNIDLCATAQLGCLFMKMGMGDQGTLQALEKEIDGNYLNSWTAKYHLDLLMLYELERV